jgi:hypothetical protein
MIQSMQQVVPDVHIDVQYAISEMWAKNAEVVVDEEGRLGVWKAVKIQGGKQSVAEASMVVSA